MKNDYKVVGGRLSFRQKRRRRALLPLALLLGGMGAVTAGVIGSRPADAPDPEVVALALPSGSPASGAASGTGAGTRLSPSAAPTREATEVNLLELDARPPEGREALRSAPDPEAAAPAPAPETAFREEVEVAPGDSLIRIFKRAGAGTAGLYRMLEAEGVEHKLARIHPGQRMELELDAGRELVAFTWYENERTAFHARRTDRGFVTRTQRVAPPEPPPAPSPPVAEAAGPAPVAQRPAAASDGLAAAPAAATRKTVVGRGDTLSGIFDRQGLPQEDLIRLLANKDTKRKLSQLHPGQELVFELDTGGRLQSMVWNIDPLESLEIRRTPDGFRSALVKTELEHRIAVASGEIRSSLFEAGLDAGVSENVIMQMIEILAWDIDFVLDIRTGDKFSVLYEEIYDTAGKKLKDGRIVAVDFANRGRIVTALRYTDPAGHTDYYSPSGHSMRKAFLRTPVKFSRISSGFSLKRWHPILERPRSHKGVDYAAPVGTPVKATGDGKVIYKGWKGGYGKTVVLQHGGRYTTLYAHMSRYARLAAGQRVRQGDTIGYIGQTGLATGPHLHYEFRVDGTHRDPLKVDLPEANPLPEKYLADFRTDTGQYLAELERLRETQLALNEQ